MSYDRPQIPPLVVENEPKATKDTLNPTNNENTEDVQPQAVQSESPVSTSKPVTSKPAIAPVSASKPNPKASIPYPPRRNDERSHKKANNQIEKLYQNFKDMSFKISFADALILMAKFASTLKALIGNKEKLSEMARTPFNEHCSAVLLKKLPEKLRDPGKFLIRFDFSGMVECLALADLGASINLMPFSVWKILSLPDLTPTCMTLELADHSISRPVGVAKDVYVNVGSFHFLADFVVVDFDADPRVQNSGLIPLISESFQAMARLCDFKTVKRAVFSSTLKSFAMMTSNLSSPSKNAYSRWGGTLPSNTIANPKSDLKAITTRSSMSYDRPQIPPLVVENEPKATKDTLNPTNNENTEDVQPQAVQSESPVSTSKPVTSKPAIAPVSASKPNPKASIPYPPRRNDERSHKKANNQIE
nr:reverse transcriptase domain-containing protein [Tanacetum cinerariifolium]